MTKRRITKEIKEALATIMEAHGGVLRWQDVVRAAKDHRSPLHSWFDYSPKRAMEEYLRQQAEDLIQRWTVVSTTPDGERHRFRAAVSLSVDRVKGGGYRSTIAVLSDRDLRARLLEDALAELAAFQERYRKLKELAQVFAAIGRAMGRRDGLAKRRGEVARSARVAEPLGR